MDGQYGYIYLIMKYKNCQVLVMIDLLYPIWDLMTNMSFWKNIMEQRLWKYKDNLLQKTMIAILARIVC